MKRLSACVVILSLLVIFPCFGQNYIIGENDVIKITVYDNDDLASIVRVTGEGIVVLPLIGRVNVAGLSTDQIAQKITSLYADGYIINPQVNVFVDEYRSKKAIIFGEINNPGLIELREPITFLGLISKAGGLSRDAGHTAILKRKNKKDGGQEEIIKINLKELIEKGKTNQDIVIEDGDSIYIEKAPYYYVTGEVAKPNAYKFEENTTVLQAITRAGGFTGIAAKSRVKIVRKINGEEKVLKRVKMDAIIMENDVIVVPESFF